MQRDDSAAVQVALLSADKRVSDEARLHDRIRLLAGAQADECYGDVGVVGGRRRRAIAWPRLQSPAAVAVSLLGSAR